MLLSLVVAMPGALLRWAILRRPIGQGPAIAITAVVVVSLVWLSSSDGVVRTPIYATLGPALLYFCLVAPKKLHAPFVMNALLAEHSLSLIELVKENPFALSLRDAIVSVYRHSQPREMTFDEIARSFNEEGRLVQLNIIAMAFNELVRSPTLHNAEWLPVANPFVVDADDKLIRSVAEQLSKKHKVAFGIANGKFELTEDSLLDRQNL
jgi:hypothetical protein